MPVPLLSLPLNRTLQGRDRAGVLTATGSGAVRYVDGPWNDLPPGPNLLLDPAVTSNSWVGVGTGTYTFGNGVEITGSGSGNGARLRSSWVNAATLNLDHQITFDVSLVSGNADWEVFVEEWNSSVSLSSSVVKTITATSTKTTISVTYRPTVTGATKVLFGLRRASAGAGVINVSNVQIDQRHPTTNYMRNPSAEVNDLYWSNVGSGVNRTYDTTEAAFGSACVRIDFDGTVAIQGVYQYTDPGLFSVGDVVTGSAYIKGPAGKEARILVREDAGGAFTASPRFMMDGTWQRISVTHTITPGFVSYMHVRIDNSNFASTAGTIYVDGMQLEKGPLATPYFDGSIGGNVAWTGTPHLSTSIRFRTQAAFVEEGTTNIIPNPSAEVDATQGTGATAGATVTRDTSTGWSGSSSFKVVTVGTATQEGIVHGVSGLSYTGSARTFTGSAAVKGAGNVGVWIRATYSDASILDSPIVVVPLTSEWQRIIPNTITVNPAKTVTLLQIHVRTSGIQAITYWDDGVQIEEKAYATSYCDGSLGTGYAWTGTAHASASTRSSTRIYVDGQDHVGLNRGALVCWFQCPVASNASFIFGFAGVNGGNTSRLYLQHQADHRIAGMIGDPATTRIDPTVAVPGQWYQYSIEWDNGTMWFYRGTTVVADAVPYVGFINMDNSADFGSLTGGQNLNAPLGPVLIFDRPLTNAERTKLFAASRPWAWGLLAGRRQLGDNWQPGSFLP